MKIFIEHTDTFGGEANYSWVRRKEIEIKDTATDRQIIRAAKKAIEMNGVRCKTTNFGDSIELRPEGLHQVIFISFE